MTITVEPTNFNASSDLLDEVEKIFSQLNRYNDQITNIDIYLQSEPETDQKLKKVKAKILIPGHDLFAEEEAGDFISASQQLHDKMKRLLRDQKEKDKANRNPRPDKP